MMSAVRNWKLGEAKLSTYEIAYNECARISKNIHFTILFRSVGSTPPLLTSFTLACMSIGLFGRAYALVSHALDTGNGVDTTATAPLLSL